MHLTSGVDMKQYYQKQLVDVGQKVLAVVAIYKKSQLLFFCELRVFDLRQWDSKPNGLTLICCHQSFKSSCINQVNGDYIGSRKLLIVLSVTCCNGAKMQVLSWICQTWLTKL